MIKIFYRQGGEVVFAPSETEFASISKENVLWIDLYQPTGEEKRATEAYLHTDIQTRAEAEEIESSSRYSEEDGFVFANTNFLSPSGDEMSMEPVSFILADGILTTLRESPLRSFNTLQMKIQARPEEYENGWQIFIDIVDKRVDLDADIVELLSKDASQFSKRINQQEDINEEFLLDINQLQENAMFIRENIVDKQRILSNLSKSKRLPKDPELRDQLNVILQDVASLISHVNFTFERLEYLQDTVLGVINLDQNKIMKIFTLVSVLLMPATLVASFYGMNVELPLADRTWAWLGITALMLLLIVGIWFIFKKKKMF